MTESKKYLLKKNLILNNSQKIGIYGTGLAGIQTLKALTKMNINVDFFLDGGNKNIGEIVCGREIADINKVCNEAIILIAANPAYRIHERLEQAGLKQWDYVDPEWLWLYSNGFNSQIKDILKENSDKIRQAYDMLKDELSKKVMRSVLKHRVEHELALIDEIYDANQYFGNDIIPAVNGNFVDCGAFNGDTLKRFIKQSTGGGYWYYAFEAEKQNYDAIMAYCKENEIRNIDVYNLAVSDQKKVFSFVQDGNDRKVAGKIVDGLNTDCSQIQGDLIDNILCDVKVDMITMDIEGAEVSALNGAKRCIEAWHPKLAISAYHTIEHLWEIPLLINDLDSGYQIYYRHHQWNMHDTVCYAV